MGTSAGTEGVRNMWTDEKGDGEGRNNSPACSHQSGNQKEIIDQAYAIVSVCTIIPT